VELKHGIDNAWQK